MRDSELIATLECENRRLIIENDRLREEVEVLERLRQHVINIIEGKKKS